jgi:hypothetical protein
MKIYQNNIIEYWLNRISFLYNLDYSYHIGRLEPCDVLLFCHDADRPLDLNGKAYSPLIDSVREDFESRGLSCRTFAHFGSSLTGKKGIGDPIPLNSVYIMQRIMKKISSLLNISGPSKYDPFKRIFEKTRAKLIITIGFPAELAEASKSAGLFHVELLHGVGYAFLPWGWDELPSKHLPQTILSLDKVSTNSFSPLLKKEIDVLTIPHPFLKKFTSDKINYDETDWRVKIDNSKKYSKHILVTLVWSYAGDHGLNYQFSNILDNGLFYKEIEELVEEERDVFWHFRFHPVQLRNKRYKKLWDFMNNFVLSHPNSEWKEASRVPLSAIAIHCDGNIGMSSMSCYDAATTGVPSIMLCPTVQTGGVHENWFVDLENEGYVTKSSVNKEILRGWVKQTHKISPRLSNLGDEIAWENAVEFILKKSGLKQHIKK